MGGPREQRIEAAIDRGAAAVLGGAVAFALIVFFDGKIAPLQLRLAAAGFAAIVYVLTVRALRRVGPERAPFEVRTFSVADLEFEPATELLLTEQVELVLTDADRLHAASAPADEELLLDQVATELSSDSGVVRLFDPAAMPTPGQLNARIEQRLRDGTPPAADPANPSSDASQALYQALAELRRSLR